MNGNDLVARKVGRVRMESLSGNHKTVNAFKAMNSGKLIGSIIEFAILYGPYNIIYIYHILESTILAKSATKREVVPKHTCRMVK